jgi:hypothetical protein
MTRDKEETERIIDSTLNSPIVNYTDSNTNTPQTANSTTLNPPWTMEPLYQFGSDKLSTNNTTLNCASNEIVNLSTSNNK